MSKSKKEERLWRTHTTIYGDKIQCVRYENALDCDFKFLDEYGYVINCQWNQRLKKKNPHKSPFEKTIRGVACVGRLSNGEGEIPKPYGNHQLTKEYECYSNMLSRCYNSDGTIKVRNDGTIVTVREDWLCFSTFVEDIRQFPTYDVWLYSESRTIDLDKDYICFLGEDVTKIVRREYSKDTCIFISKPVNLDGRKITQPFYKGEVSGVILYSTGTDLDKVVNENPDIALKCIRSIRDNGSEEKRARITEESRKKLLDKLVNEKIRQIEEMLEKVVDEDIINDLQDDLERYKEMLITGVYEVDDIKYTLDKELLE